MQDSKENPERNKQESDMQQEVLRLREMLNQREVEILTSNQREFNKFLLREVFTMQDLMTAEFQKLKDGLNQLGESLAGEESSDDVDTEQDDNESVDTQIPRSKYDEELERKQAEIKRLEEEMARNKEIVKKRGRPSLK